MNPLHRPKYDARAFHVWNWGVRRSIIEYDEIPKNYPAALKYFGNSAERPSTTVCADIDCQNTVGHRRKYCEPHRLERYKATKHRRKGDGQTNDTQPDDAHAAGDC